MVQTSRLIELCQLHGVLVRMVNCRDNRKHTFDMNSYSLQPQDEYGGGRSLQNFSRTTYLSDNAGTASLIRKFIAVVNQIIYGLIISKIKQKRRKVIPVTGRGDL
jgi:hypothetical protein